MRDTTRIKACAEEALADLARIDTTSLVEVDSVKSNLQEIIRTATKMDARTGTIDPSERKKG